MINKVSLVKFEDLQDFNFTLIDYCGCVILVAGDVTLVQSPGNLLLHHQPE